MSYAELHCISNFTFLQGASHPEELVARAAALNYRALAITDECSLAGVVRAHVEAKRQQLHLIIGSRFRLDDGLSFVVLATNRKGYGQLSSLISMARRNANKGDYHLTRLVLTRHSLSDCLALWLPGEAQEVVFLNELFPKRLWIAAELSLTGRDRTHLEHLRRLSQRHDIPLTATGNVQMHQRNRRILHDTLTAIRLSTPLAQLGKRLAPNGEGHLRPYQRLAKIYPQALLHETLAIAERCNFSLDELHYEYPSELVPEGYNATDWLRIQVEAGAKERWPQGVPDKVRKAIEHELALIAELKYEPYFLTIYDIVCFARSQKILCQGRGSAANSTVCYCLGITAVDPARMALLFERFISKERNEPPDIDVDFENARREEVIQYIYRKYGRDRAALVATVITYQPRSAIRDVGKALGLSRVQVERLARSTRWWDSQVLIPGHLAEMGFSAESPLIKRLITLVEMLLGFPRHLSQHVGGFIISAGPLTQLVPIENAAMQERTIIQWEKDDVEALGLLKMDVLALGMLTALRKALGYIGASQKCELSLADIPAEDPKVYEMISRADTVGLFQIESRAQMSMLPRLRPRNYYDLVIQIAIVRPGPIQGDMVHPYLLRRSGKAPVTYPSEAIRSVLERTLGVPIFQEQVMQIAMVAAGFSAGEADQLRRAMAAWKRKGGLEPFEEKLHSGMRKRGYSDEFARQIFRQIRGFSDYGFPESHSASFALLAYASAWMKLYHPAVFVCALLNSQPMGFYAPAQLIQDAKRHGVEVRPIDVRFSEADSTLEYDTPREQSEEPSPQPALRLGLNMVKGLSEEGIQNLIDARKRKAFVDVGELANRAKLHRTDLQALASADALQGFSGDRYRAQWQVSGVEEPLPLFQEYNAESAEVMLPKPDEQEEIIADYASSGVSLRRHPVALLRPRLNKRRVHTAQALWSVRNGAVARTAGLVIGRQRPGTASGVIFVTLEDETGQANVIVWPKIAEAQRKPLLQSQLLIVSGIVQQQDGVLHLVAGRLEDRTDWLGDLQTKSRDFH
ncbi:MAG: error-prone DNA polymerase [Candidatus Thiodiazotropha weberae]|nr:error-prone DNA polymerase [Candidatus Thiodiazotropha lotti]MCG8019965.1 error-prone DNA polymerase [Candidatus Thiodiazotropha lotti]MCW4207127.1 error-prone DNA polymerase [Candidatus Thiodiazotropha lotti]MCW4215653.1 error-prone DNA polymerase [Candidatus Thiodiazotropha lotti]